jgi:hypothetical protein
MARRLLVPITALLLAAASQAGAEDGAVDLDRFRKLDGDWQRVSERDDPARLRAIERAIADLSWVTRTMAGPMLRRTTTPPDHYAFRLDAEAIWLAERHREPRPLRLDGSERRFEGDHGEVTTTARALAGAIETRWQTHQAWGTTTFRLADDGGLMVESLLQITAISGIEPIRYQARFERTASLSSAR